MWMGLLVLDYSAKVAHLSASALDLLSYRRDEVECLPCQEIFPGLAGFLTSAKSKAVEADASSSQRRHLLNGEENQLTLYARCKDGRLIPLLFTINFVPETSLAGGDREPAKTVVILQDARELKKIEKQLCHADRLRSLDEFTAGIVHEIRNPLAGISINAQYIMGKLRPDDQFHEEMTDILTDARIIESIVSKVLDFAHPNKPDVKEIVVKELVEEVLKLSKVQFRCNNIKPACAFDQSCVKIKGDVLQMKQVLMNIIRNACAAMPEGGEFKVSCRTIEAEKLARLEFADTGPGIPPEQWENIFQPFCHVSADGTGLGLAISRKIIENHGGHITVKSKIGQGTSFVISLPALPRGAAKQSC